MKKPVNKIEDPSLAITATLADPHILKNLVEQLAKRRHDIGYSLEKVEPGWRAIETSSIEAHVSGDTNPLHTNESGPSSIGRDSGGLALVKQDSYGASESRS